MSQTMNLHPAPEVMNLHPGQWAGRIMSAFVVIVLVADGAIQLFAPAQIASMLQETGFAMDLTRVVGPLILACAILYAIPATAVLGAILVTGFLGG
ncbi:MAG: DoxX family protein, partial [Roseiarcus sp.]|uniref:DoxX family protein n=1 Tax=Roseiarcus sp. TaxID=1969460 RepID=UPI003C37CBBD